MNFTHELSLTEEEARIFNVLRETVAYKHRSTCVRVAGGWVRDKLLGLPNDDIDIALDDQLGSEFAMSVNEYLQHVGIPTSSICVIQANPEQSKHLETARLKVLGKEIDFVNLRAETYTADSRIPDIRFGTPLEDAQRRYSCTMDVLTLSRDFTINSMFYNISVGNGIVEDLVGSGLRDLQEGVIKTPIDAMVTFHDDPLRVLRAIRFAARFAYRLDESLASAAAHADIHHALLQKVSRERILKEMQGCMESNTNLCRPILALSMMQQTGLFRTIFTPSSETVCYSSKAAIRPEFVVDMPIGFESVSMKTAFWVNALLHMLTQSHMNIFMPSASACDDLLLQHDFLLQPLPYKNITYPPATIDITDSTATSLLFCVNNLWVVEKKKLVPLSNFVLLNQLKASTDLIRKSSIMLSCVGKFQECAKNVHSSLRREELGSVIKVAKELWSSTLLLACAEELASGTASENIEFLLRNCHLLSREKLIIEKYQRLYVRAIEWELQNIWELKPLYNGKELQNLLGISAPMTSQYLEIQFLWQLKHPNGSQEPCLEYMRQIAEQDRRE